MDENKIVIMMFVKLLIRKMCWVLRIMFLVVWSGK